MGSVGEEPVAGGARPLDAALGIWVLVVAGLIVLATGVAGLFAEFDDGPTVAALWVGAALTAAGVILATLRKPTHQGAPSIVAETLFSYTDAKARMVGLALPEPLRGPLRQLARGDAAQAYLEVVLRAPTTDDEGRAVVAVDAERIADAAVDRAGASLAPLAPLAARAVEGSEAPVARDTTFVTGPRADTLEQPLPPSR